MAFSKTLLVSSQDIYLFEYKATCNTKIHKFWKQIIGRMSKDLQNEVRSKATNLVIDNKEKNTYKFKTRYATVSLQKHLSNYQILLINKSNIP